MADDPLAGQVTAPDLPDPLAGWTPAVSAPAAPPPPPKKGVMDTSYKSLPSDTRQGDEWATGNVATVRSAFGEGYAPGGSDSVVQPDITYPNLRSIWTPDFQRSWAGRNLFNALGTAVGTGIAGLSGAGNAVATLGNEALRSIGVPDSLIRDINTEVTRRAGEVPTTSPDVNLAPGERPLAREMMQPPAPTPIELAQAQEAARKAALRANAPPDATTDATIALLRRTNPNAAAAVPRGDVTMPSPPQPFTPSLLGEQPPATPPSSGLLAVPPRPGPTPAAADAMTAAQMRARARGYYSPADQQAAQGVTINGDYSDAIRQPLIDAIPTDPEKAGYIGDNALIQMGRVAQANKGNPMSFDTAMSLDRQLTDRKQAAYRTGDYTLADQIEEAQDAIRAKMQSAPDSVTTGDASTLANLPAARQAYGQAVKQSQLEDINYRAGLLPEDKQGAYVRGQVKSMLGNDRKMANWSPDERASLEQQLQSGNIGSLTNLGISLIKPAVQAGGAAVGGSVFGTPGAIVGGQIAGTMGETWQSRLRNALGRITLDPVTQQLTRNMPPPPSGQ